MKKSDQLKQTRAEKVTAQGLLISTAETANRDFTAEEQTQFDALESEIRSLDTNIASAVAVEAAKERAAKNAGTRIDGGDGEPAKEKRAFSINKAIRALISGEALEGAELEAHNRAKEAAREAGIGLSVAGIAVPMFDSRSVETRADGQTVTGDSGAYGATTVATDKGAPIDYLRPQPVVEKLGATFLTGLIGNLSFPKNNGGVTAAWKGEVAAGDLTKDAWDEVELTPKRLTVSVLISLQNLMQSSFDMEAYTMKVIRDEIANKLDKAALVGSGSGEPTGILNASGTTAVAIGTNGGAPTFPKIVELETGVYVQNANSAKMGYVSNAKVRGKLKTTVKESGQPVYLMDANGMVNGYDYFNSNHIPSTLTKGTTSGTCSAIIFGDFSKLVVAQWGFMDLTVNNMSRKIDGYVEITANVFADVAVLEPKAFAVCKDVTTT